MDQSKQQQQKSTRPLYIINLFDIKTTVFCDAHKIPNNTFTFILRVCPLSWHSHKLHYGTLQVLALKAKFGLSPSAQVEHVKLTLCACETFLCGRWPSPVNLSHVITARTAMQRENHTATKAAFF